MSVGALAGCSLYRGRARGSEQRERQEPELGFADVEALVRQRCLVEGNAVDDIAAELGCTQITLITEWTASASHAASQTGRLSLGRH
jgi:hypothetical protein